VSVQQGRSRKSAFTFPVCTVDTNSIIMLTGLEVKRQHRRNFCRNNATIIILTSWKTLDQIQSVTHPNLSWNEWQNAF